MFDLTSAPYRPQAADPAPARLPIPGGNPVDFIQLLRGPHMPYVAQLLTRCLADSNYTTRGGSCAPNRKTGQRTVSHRLHESIRPPIASAFAHDTCVSPDCLQSAEWRIQARCVTKPLGPATASKPASYLLTPARTNQEKAAIVYTRLVVDQMTECPRCHSPQNQVVEHLLWDCPGTTDARTTMNQALAELAGRHRISPQLLQNVTLLQAMTLGETDQMYSKPPMNAQTTAATLADGILPTSLIADINASTVAPSYRKVTQTAALPPVLRVLSGGNQINLGPQQPPGFPYLDSSWRSATETLKVLGAFLVECLPRR